MSVESAPLQGITLYSHADDFRSHWIRYVLAEKQIKYILESRPIITPFVTDEQLKALEAKIK